MNTYLLLRNNKETGPHTTDDLVKMGLKSYDLIWVEGKSAAWRYPCEVDELKKYAPSVEEQPFDRFFKKDVAGATTSISNVKNVAEAQTATIKQKPRIRIKAEWSMVETAAPIAAPQHATTQASAMYIPAAPKQSEIRPKQEAVTAKQIQKPGWENSWLDWQQEKSAVKQASQKADSDEDQLQAQKVQPVLENKFSQSLNEIKEKYAATVLKAKNKAIEWRSFKSVAVIIMLAVPLMCFGVWLGHKWTAKEEAGKVVYAKTAPATPADNQQAATDAKNPVDNTDNTTPAENKKAVQNENSKEMIPGFDDADNNNAKPEAKQQPKQAVVKHNASLNVPQRQQVLPSKPLPQAVAKNQNNIQPVYKKTGAPQQQYGYQVPGNASPGTRTKTINPALLGNQNGYAANSQRAVAVQQASIKKNDDDEENSPVYTRATHKQKMADFVSVEAEQPYNENVQDLKLNVQNIADIPLDLVVIDIEYFDAANRFRNGQTIHIKNLPAGEALNVKVPDNASATRIRYKVSLISAEQKGVYLVGD